MIGRFVGETSMGFVHGKTYFIKSKIETVRVGRKNVSCICIYDVHSKAWCPYEDLYVLIKNWDIKVLGW